MALKPFYNKKGHLGYSPEKTKKAIISIIPDAFTLYEHNGSYYADIKIFSTNEEAVAFADKYVAVKDKFTISGTYPTIGDENCTFYRVAASQYAGIKYESSHAYLLIANMTVQHVGSEYRTAFKVFVYQII